MGTHLSRTSLPLRKCGLKCQHPFSFIQICRVTSLAEVWIEIWYFHPAMHTDLSLPLRKCGLKYDRNEGCNQWGQVTSLAEVWIEMPSPYITSSPRSHFPCGSVDWNCNSLCFGHWHSVTSLAEVWIEILHHPYAIALHRVTSLAEVWIEIPSLCLRTSGCLVTSLAEVWIEMSIRLSGDARWRGHFPCGSVDWNGQDRQDIPHEIRHFPCGSVDWNHKAWFYTALVKVTSLAEVWIEIII